MRGGKTFKSFEIMKKYIDAKCEIVNVQNDILTSSLGIDNTPGNNLQGDAPTRRSIWN